MSVSIRNAFGQHRTDADAENKPVQGAAKKTLLAGGGVTTRAAIAQRSVLGDINSRARNTAAGNGKAGAVLKKPTTTKTTAAAVSSIARKPLQRANTNSSTAAVAPKSSTIVAHKPAASPAPAVTEFSHEHNQAALRAYSSGVLPLVDIDSDEADPHLVSEYTGDIYLYLRSLETRFRVRADHLAGSAITAKMREVLVDWLVQVHLQFRLLPETLQLTVAVLDRFLQAVPTLTPVELQLAGTTSMWVASKYEEIYAPELNDFVVIAGRSFSGEQMRVMERRMLRALNFEPARPLGLHFLRRCSKAGGVDSRQHALAKYVLELSLQEYQLASVDVSRVAAAALCFSLQVLNDDQTTQWNAQMHCYSFYSEHQLRPLVSQLAALVVVACNKLKEPMPKRAMVARKYASKRFLCISTMPELSAPLVKQLANQSFEPYDL